MGEGLPDIGRLGDDLATVLAHVDASGAVVAGQSMGGMSIQAYLGRHPGDAAGRLSGAVLVATASRTFGPTLTDTSVPATVLVGTRDLLTPPRSARH